METLTSEPTDWATLIDIISSNWDEENIFNEEYVIKGVIKGMKQGNIIQIEMDGVKNKYKGHSYKLNK